jgi:selenoprotein W-related protein
VRAVSLADLLKKHCNAEVELVKSSGGVFEVTVDGELVYSKKATGTFPEEKPLLKLITEKR